MSPDSSAQWQSKWIKRMLDKHLLQLRWSLMFTWSSQSNQELKKDWPSKKKPHMKVSVSQFQRMFNRIFRWKTRRKILVWRGCKRVMHWKHLQLLLYNIPLFSPCIIFLFVLKACDAFLSFWDDTCAGRCSQKKRQEVQQHQKQVLVKTTAPVLTSKIHSTLVLPITWGRQLFRK